jgi:hypothetical protein
MWKGDKLPDSVFQQFNGISGSTKQVFGKIAEQRSHLRFRFARYQGLKREVCLVTRLMPG